MRYFFIFLLSFSYTAWLWANDAQLENVTITSSAQPQFSPQNFIGNHQTLDKKDWQQRFVLLPDLLAEQSGIEIHNLGGVGQYSTPIIRGASGQQVLVFFDGLQINSLNGGGANLGNLSLNSAQKVDIYRSLAPIELTASAMGGVIHLQSPELNQGKNHGQARMSLGSYGVQQYQAQQAVNLEKNSLYFSVDYLKADNDFEYLEQHPVSNPNQPAYEKRYNNGSEQYHLLLKSRHNLAQHRFDFALQKIQAKQELSAAINFPQNDAHIDSQQESLQLRWQSPWQQYQSEILTQLMQQKQRYDDRHSRIGLGAQLNTYSTTGYKIQFNQYARFKNSNLVFTAREHQESTDTDFELLTDAQVQKQCANGYGCETAYERVQRDLGVRAQYWLGQTSLIAQASLLYLDDRHPDLKNQKSQRANTWYLAAQHDFISGFFLLANISSQLRLPATSELFGDRGTSIGNANLLPEEALHYELGTGYSANNWRWDASLYLRQVENAIVGESDSRGVVRFSNLAQTQHAGLEQNITVDMNEQFSIAGNLSLQSNEIIRHKTTPFYEGNQVANIRPLQSFVRLNWQKNNWDAFLSYHYALGGYYTNSNLLEKDTEHRLDAGLGFNRKNWRLSFNITDIADQAVRDYPSYPEPGRMYFVRLNYQW